ncbi:hypothetical protein EJ110_NYTH45607 [Nymphaea thermarum]|nr:hypothetical protein EJ110_NYTH45607 [Nymphaea thermarum]
MYDMKSVVDQCQEITKFIYNRAYESCVKLLKVCVSLIKVLQLADSEDRPSIRYLYEAMDKAKETILDKLKKKKKLYIPI